MAFHASTQVVNCRAFDSHAPCTVGGIPTPVPGMRFPGCESTKSELPYVDFGDWHPWGGGSRRRRCFIYVSWGTAQIWNVQGWATLHCSIPYVQKCVSGSYSRPVANGSISRRCMFVSLQQPCCAVHVKSQTASPRLQFP